MLKSLGQRIRQIRKEKKLTLVEISKRTGIAQATLSRIETGTMMGTVESHEKISEVLGIGIAELYAGADPRRDQTFHLTQQSERKITLHTRSVQVELLTSESSKKKITPLLLTLQEGAETETEHNDRGVEKFVFVLEGEISVRIEKEDYIVKTGETLYFDASLPHQISNKKAKLAKVLAAVSPSKI